MKIKIILLTGAMRSGTSVLGKIIGSLRDVEFFYEPMIFVKLLMNPACSEMFDDYIYSDLIMPALAGRNLNLNRNDDSSIFNYKSENFIEDRMARSWSADEIHSAYSGVGCLIKYPTYITQIASFSSSAFPLRKVFIFREPNGNLNSLLRKRWFSDEVISSGIRGEFKKLNSRNVPLWVEDSDVERFLSMDEEGRCLFYYNKTLSANLDQFDVVMSYELLCNDPLHTVEILQNKLGAQPGEVTQALLKNMRPEKVVSVKVAKHNSEAYEAAIANYDRVKVLSNV